MAQQRGNPPGYDWESGSVPSEPEPVGLPGPSEQLPHAGEEPRPDVTASAFDDGSPLFGAADGDEGAERTGRGLPPWAIVAIVALQVVALVATVGLVVGGVLRLIGDVPEPVASPSATQPPPQDQQDQEREPGVVTDSEGVELSDGTGSYSDPATVDDHTVSWPTWTDGTISVTARDVELAATLPGADGVDVVEDGYRMVIVAFEVRYDGSGQLAPAEELWLTGESERTYFQDISDGLIPDPMKAVPPLGDGESAAFRSVFVVPEQDVDSLRLGVETFTGETLYYAAR